MFVFNNFKHDTRVLKEAKTLVSAGYLVTVVAVLDKTSSSYEEQDGFRVFRLTIEPVHLGIVKWMSKITFGHFFCISGFKKQEDKEIAGKRVNFLLAVTKVLLKSCLSIVLFLIKGLCFMSYVFYQIPKKATTISILPTCFLRLKRMLFHRQFLVKGLCFMSYVFYQIPKKATTISILPTSFLKQKIMIFHRQFCFLEYYFRCLKLIKRMPADIYHAHDLNTLPIAWWAARKNGAKLVYDAHELYLERNRYRPYSRLWKFIVGRIEAFLIRRAHAVITVNETIANELASRYMVQIPGVIMNAPSMDSSAYITSTGNGKSIRVALGIGSDLHLLLYTGSITFNRGLEKVIESLVYLPDCHLVLMGYGSDKFKAGLQALALETGVGPRFSFFGPVPSEEVTTYASCADLGIAPIKNVCLSYYYCSPNKLFEYILAGVPVIASNFPEMEKVIHKYEIGYTFDPEDPRGIARVIRKVFDNPQHYQKMKQNTINASSAYNWEKESKKLLEIYQTLS